MRTFNAYLPALLWAATVLGIGSLTSIPAPSSSLPFDKAAHFAMYGIMGALCARGWLRAGRRPAAVLMLVAVIAIGAMDELHQRSVVGRSSEAADWVADIAGAVAGFTIVARRGPARMAFGEKRVNA